MTRAPYAYSPGGTEGFDAYGHARITLSTPRPRATTSRSCRSQFDDVEQQSEASTLGMWLFLATEVMFFGGLLTAYAVYRIGAHREVALASKELNVSLGCVNTVVLLTSSLTMALAVRAAQLRARRELVGFLIATMVLGNRFPRDQGGRVDPRLS